MDSNKTTAKAKEKDLSVAEKYALTAEEAAVYFRIGENKLRTSKKSQRNRT